MTTRSRIPNAGQDGSMARAPSDIHGFSGGQGNVRPLGNNFAKDSTAEKILMRDHKLLVRLSKA